MAALGPLAQEVLEVLVAAGTPLSVREVLDRVNRSRPVPLAYTTVMTVLARLVSRGTAIRERAGRGFRYSAETADPAAFAVNEVLREHGDAAVAHFVSQAAVDPALRERLRQLMQMIDE